MKIGQTVAYAHIFAGAECTVIHVDGNEATLQHAGGATKHVRIDELPAAPVDDVPAAPVAKKTTTTTKASKANG